MKQFSFLLTLALLYTMPRPLAGQESFDSDTFETSMGTLEITFIGHGTLMFQVGDKVIHVDPVGREADYSQMPDADLVVVTHEHGDHLDAEAIAEVTKEGTQVVLTQACADAVEGGATVLGNGESLEWEGIDIEAVPAYNIVHERSPGQVFHPEGNGNGYVLAFGDTRVYVAGDTENTPEMKALEDIDIAFLPMNLPYTMTPEMVADAARAFRPDVLYPYHFGETDPQRLVELLENEGDIDVRVRDLQ